MTDFFQSHDLGRNFCLQVLDHSLNFDIFCLRLCKIVRYNVFLTLKIINSSLRPYLLSLGFLNFVNNYLHFLSCMFDHLIWSLTFILVEFTFYAFLDAGLSLDCVIVGSHNLTCALSILLRCKLFSHIVRVLRQQVLLHTFCQLIAMILLFLFKTEIHIFRILCSLGSLASATTTTCF